MRILILGAGGVGGHFGARVAAAGGDVSFLVRGRRAEHIAHHGLVVRSPKGNLAINPVSITRVERPYEAVILACKAYDLDSALDSIAPAIGADTLVLPLLNGVRHLDVLDARFGREKILGGVAHIGATLNAAGEIEHLNTLEFLALGAREEGQRTRARALHAALQLGGFDPRLSGSIMHDMWEKFSFLAAYAGLTSLMRAPIGAICATTRGRSLALGMFRESAAVAEIAGFPLRSEFERDSQATLSDPASSGTSSMARDIAKGARTEHEHVVGDMLKRGRAADIPMPLLEIAYTHLQAYDIVRTGSPVAASG